MTPAQYRHLMARFEALCDAGPAEQAAGIAALRAEDAALGESLSLMLAADSGGSGDSVGREGPRTPAPSTRHCPTCGEGFGEEVAFCPRHGSRLLDPTPAPGDGDPLTGTLLDKRYRIDALLGSGGMARVYRAQQVNVQREVAVKVLHAHLRAHPVVLRRFEREARIIAGLRHPNTLKLIDFGQTTGGAFYIVTPLLRGRSLDVALAEDGRFGVDRTLALLRQIAAALGEAHEAGIVHRDLKPGNIFVESVGGEDVFKVLDFGIAQWRGGTEHRTDTGISIGTPAYMSPEQIEADRALDGRSDIYSLGVVAYACLTGRLPWDNISAANMAIKHLHEPPRPFETVLPAVAVPPQVERLVRWMLEKAVDARPADVHALRAAIDAVVAGIWTGPLGPGSTETPDPQTRASARRGSARRWAGGLAAVGIVLALAWLAVDPSPPPAERAAPPAGDPPPSVTLGADTGPADARVTTDVAASANAARANAARADAGPPQPDTAVDRPPVRTAPARPPRTRPGPAPTPPKPDYVPAPGLY